MRINQTYPYASRYEFNSLEPFFTLSVFTFDACQNEFWYLKLKGESGVKGMANLESNAISASRPWPQTQLGLLLDINSQFYSYLFMYFVFWQCVYCSPDSTQAETTGRYWQYISQTGCAFWLISFCYFRFGLIKAPKAIENWFRNRLENVGEVMGIPNWALKGFPIEIIWLSSFFFTTQFHFYLVLI